MNDQDRERVYPKTESQIRSEIADARARLADSVQQLTMETQPKTLKNEAIDAAKAVVDEQVTMIKGQFVDQNGVRMDRVAMIAGGLAGTALTLVTLRQLVKSGQSAKARRLAKKELAALAGGPIRVRVKTEG